MISCLVVFLPLVSGDRSSHESSWERRVAGGDLGTDGVSLENTPALLNSLEPPAGVEINGIDRGGTVTLAEEQAELEEGRSPVEEAGHVVEDAEDEDLASTVEEGEEAALALDPPPSDSQLPWLKQVCAADLEGDPPSPEAAGASSDGQSAGVSSTERCWNIGCQSPADDPSHSSNVA